MMRTSDTRAIGLHDDVCITRPLALAQRLARNDSSTR
jgi:hypothetical protein